MNFDTNILLRVKTLNNFTVNKNTIFSLRKSQAPERSRAPRACRARSGTNGEGGVRSLRKLDQIFGDAKNGNFGLRVKAPES